MKLEAAEKIIKDENLNHINWYDASNLSENQVGIRLDNGEWTIFVTDERASIVWGSVIKFSSEEEALDVIIRKARYFKKNFR